ncbi:MAG: glycosyltransferase family 9 protein [Planctomycetes bacterium]|nr:glycosyltransferase family 9 protein [Planctomycetota bacterium]
MTAVLCSRLSAMGDLVHCLGAIVALHRERPEWQITVVTQSDFVDLLRGLPGVHRTVGFDRRGGLAALRRVRAELSEERYDHGLDLQGNWKSALILRLSGARERIGAAAPWRREPSSRMLLHRTVEVAGTDHPALVAHALVRQLAPEVSFEPTRLEPDAAEVAAEATELQRLGIDASSPFRVIVVTDPRDPRALSPEVVAAETVASPHPVVHLFGPAEAQLLAAGAVALRHGPGSVRRLVALGNLVAAAGGEVLGPDQGASHVLAAAGAPCRLWFGAQDPARTAPVLATALVHRDPPACSPCRRRRCNHEAGPVCRSFSAAEARIVPFTPPT